MKFLAKVLFALVVGGPFAFGHDSGSLILTDEMKDDITVIRTSIGPVIRREKAPEIYDVVESVFGKLERVQEEQFKGHSVPINYIFVLDSPYENAFVSRAPNKGVRVATHLVFITTAMLNRLFQFDSIQLARNYPDLLVNHRSSAEYESGLNRLAGILGHELAHPLDKLTEWNRGEGQTLSIEREYGARASQALEISTDIHGAGLLRKSNLPEESVYLAHRRALHIGNTGNESAISTAVESHPEDNLRATAMRLYLTTSRLAHGRDQLAKTPQVPGMTSEKLENALKRYVLGAGPVPWVPAATLSETLGRMRRLSSIEDHDGNLRDLEFNRLLLWMDTQIAELERQGQMTPALRSSVADLWRTLVAQDSHPVIWNSADRSEVLAKYPDSQDLLNLPLHFFYLNSLETFRSPEMKKLYSSWIKKLNSGKRDDSTPYVLAEFMPQDIVVEHLGPYLVGAEVHALQERFGRTSRLFEIKDEKVWLRLFPRLVESLNGDESWHSLIQSYLNATRKRLFNPYFVLDGERSERESRRQLEEAVQRAILENRLPSSSMQEALLGVRNQAQLIWDNRGLFALLELLSGTGGDNSIRPERIDWEFIGRLLKIPNSQLKLSIATEVSKLIQWQSSDFLRDLELVLQEPELQSNFLTYRQVRSGDQNAEASLPVWYNSLLGQEILKAKVLPGVKGQKGKIAMRRAVFARDSKLREAEYFNKLSEGLQLPPSQAESVGQYLDQLDLNATQYMGVRGQRSNFSDYFLSPLVLGQAIAQSRLNANAKRLLLKFLFLRDATWTDEQSKEVASYFYDWMSLSDTNIRKVVEILKNQGLVANFPDLVEQIKASPHIPMFANVRLGIETKSEQAGALSSYFKFLSTVAPQIQEELSSQKSWSLEELKPYIDTLNTPRRLEVSRSESNTPNIQALRDDITKRLRIELSRKAVRKKMDQASILALWLDLTATGPSAGTDQFLDSLIAEASPLIADEQLNWYEGVLKTGRIQSQATRLNLAKIVLEPRIRNFEKAQATKEQILRLISDLNRMVPQGTLAKDKFIESLGVRLGLRDDYLHAFIEDQKTSNWQKEDPAMVNFGSVLVRGIRKMSFNKRKRFLKYLINPAATPTGLPVEIVRELIDQVYRELTQKDPSTAKSIHQAKAQEMAMQAKLEIDSFLQDASPIERIPLIEATLTVGDNSFLNSPDFPINITREILGFEPDSVSELAVLSYLKVIPEWERGPSLAYYLSQSGDEKGTVADIFALFGAPGKKLGQFASIFPIFGSEVAEEARQLKDHAPALSLYEIYKIIDREFPADLAQDIQVTDIVAAASVKTVVKIKLKSTGESAALFVQDSHLDSQNQTHLEFGRKFLTEMESQNLVKRSRMLSAMLDSLHSLLAEEVDFRLEAAKTEDVTKILADYKTQTSLGGWTIETPKSLAKFPITKAVAAYEFIDQDALPFDKLTNEQQAEVGPHLARLSLAFLFRYGVFEADRHNRNWLINPKTKTVYFLDAGQLEYFLNSKGQPDIGVVLDLLKALVDKNPDSIYQAAVKMVKADSVVPPMTEELRLDITRAMTTEDFGTSLVDLMTGLIEAGLQIERRYVFGLGKGLVILHGENYVSADAFAGILREEATGAFMRKMGMGAKASVIPYQGPANCEKLLGAKSI